MKVLAASAIAAVAVIIAARPKAYASGASLFAQNCAVCHQPNGHGLPGFYPPLADTVGAYVRTAAGRAYLVHVVSFGMTGAIMSHGVQYNGLMQSWSQLSDADLAAVLNHVLTDFNSRLLPAGFKPYTAAEVASLRARHLSLGQVHAERAMVLDASHGAGSIAPMRAH